MALSPEILLVSSNCVNYICEQDSPAFIVSPHSTECLPNPFSLFQDTERLYITGRVLGYCLKFGVVGTVLLGHVIENEGMNEF